MSRISDVCHRIEALEASRQRALLVNVLATYAADVGEVGNTLRAAQSGAATVERAFGTDTGTQLRGRLREPVQRTARAAAKLAKQIRANESFVGTNPAGNAVSDLKGLAAGARKAVADAWARALSDRCSLLRARLAVAEVAGASKAVPLRGELDRIATASFPSTAPELDSVIEFFTRADREVGAAGASEKLSAFIEAAMRGTADARELQEQEVRAFLEEHRLWSRLTVKLT